MAKKKKEQEHSEFYLKLKEALESAVEGLQTGNIRREVVYMPDPSPSVKKVFPLYHYWLLLIFTNGEIRLYDCAWMTSQPAMEKIMDAKYYKKARVSHGNVIWNKKIRLEAAVLYETSTPLTDGNGKLLKIIK